MSKNFFFFYFSFVILRIEVVIIGVRGAVHELNNKA